ncbi:MAG: hypothetical protein ACI4M3_09170 [Acutalibacteraceae bacterium]
MKKIITSVLAATFALSATVTAFAVGPTTVIPGTDGNPTPDSGTTSVTFNVAPTYTVTIPAEVVLNAKDNNGTVTYENDLTITADAGVRLLENNKIKVTMDSDFYLKTAASATYQLPYTVKIGDSTGAITSGEVVALFETKTTEQTSVLHFAAGNPEYAGNYSDTVTFNISIVES